MTAEGTDFTIYREAMIVLATAAVLVPIGQRFKLSPILGFLIAGAVLGPHGLGALTGYVAAVAVGHGLGGRGPRRHRRAGRRVPPVHHRARAVVHAPVDHAPAGVRARHAAGRHLGGDHRAHRGAARRRRRCRRCSSVFRWRCPRPRSSSRCCRAGSRFNTGTGRTSFAILLLQDLAVVPLLFLVTILGPESEGSLLGGLAAGLRAGGARHRR